MKLDLETLKTNGQQHVDQIIESHKEDFWKELVENKLKSSSPEELEMMKTLWSHGFMRGAETATRISMELYDLMNKKMVKIENK